MIVRTYYHCFLKLYLQSDHFSIFMMNSFTNKNILISFAHGGEISVSGGLISAVPVIRMDHRKQLKPNRNNKVQYTANIQLPSVISQAHHVVITSR